MTATVVPRGTGLHSPLIRSAGAGLVVLAVVGIAATRPPAAVAGRPTFDRATVAEATFPYPHLVVTRNGSKAVLTFDDGTVAPGGSVSYQVPTDGTPAGVRTCDGADMICWGRTTVDAGLSVRVELNYLDTPCVIVGSPTTPTRVECTESG